MKQEYTAIILAAGKGSRMRTDCPKQFLELAGKPVICYSLEAFEKSPVDHIILVSGEDSLEYCRTEIVDKYGFRKIKNIVAGGQERYDSVWAGLQYVKSDYVLIHDGARPFVTQEIIQRTMSEAAKTGSCVVGMPVKDTIKVTDQENYAVRTPDRKCLWQVQTPQAFATEKIRAAYAAVLGARHAADVITDDAMILEHATGEKVKLIQGSYRNIKITTKEDLLIASAFIENSCQKSVDINRK
ncbi:MAG: 2-C-methyl-D-erythritol 4-phosphate cytidylyltransferase [Eubacterium sp.]|nr:2-C-methyl-D-erythritol 4-phosphate cytidylyltransferase [Eubacterium sp.]